MRLDGLDAKPCTPPFLADALLTAATGIAIVAWIIALIAGVLWFLWRRRDRQTVARNIGVVALVVSLIATLAAVFLNMPC
ncbi:hypothetical protein [Paramicrobacterium agarici]|uniref:Uncharacterized protein n=1 Tax=Paramicrobacterium agarici TaxID=630514 RepID=A0A2A9DTW4_9MICO|nr:hypothetical protein [Microbacterium agarici]PFG29595.1 hypothetical protein ATJ78_0504 [Microbacterium agarici]